MASAKRSTILIAEDNDGLRALLASLLRDEGFHVLEAGDGIRTVRLLAQHDIDALLIDVRLGSEDGVALGRDLRLDRPDLPIALMSGDSSGSEAMSRAGGLTDVFLGKPFTLAALVATVEELLDRRTD